MQNIFGTDGIRNKANVFPMNAETVVRIGLAIGSLLRESDHPRVLIGKDTRLSGYIFESALTSGLCAMGVDVAYLGPIPTPAVAFLTESMRADLGIVISASHNPFDDNGIKFFSRNGMKIDVTLEQRITEFVADTTRTWEYPSVATLGKASRIVDAVGRYIVHIKHSFPRGMTLNGLKIVIDCANGAAYKIAPLLFQELGAEVLAINTQPNGVNINEHCGSLFPQQVMELVREHNAHLGIALDGDADRIIIIDEHGNKIDGDKILAICAKFLLEKGTLHNRKLVATVQSNMALDDFMLQNEGILIRTPVGDRFVMEAMVEHGATLGGEQSGHIIFSRYSTTGDGMLVALQIARIMLQKEKKLSELAECLTLYPQKMCSIPVKNKVPFNNNRVITNAIAEANAIIGVSGRVLVRYSGTEPLIRVMVEGEDAVVVNKTIEELASVIQQELA